MALVQLRHRGFPGNLWVTGANSLIVALIIPLGLLLAALAAYALARIKPLGARLLVVIFAIGSMVPIQIGLGPLFQTMLKLNLLDSKPGLILPYLAFGIPYQVFMLYGVFKSIPEEVEESARIDGAGTFRIFWQICLPLVKAALAALFVLDFVATWNEYAMATTLLQSQSQWTIPLAVQSFNTQHPTEYGPMNAFHLHVGRARPRRVPHVPAVLRVRRVRRRREGLTAAGGVPVAPTTTRRSDQK